MRQELPHFTHARILPRVGVLGVRKRGWEKPSHAPMIDIVHGHQDAPYWLGLGPMVTFFAGWPDKGWMVAIYFARNDDPMCAMLAVFRYQVVLISQQCKLIVPSPS